MSEVEQNQAGYSKKSVWIVGLLILLAAAGLMWVIWPKNTRLPEKLDQKNPEIYSGAGQKNPPQPVNPSPSNPVTQPTGGSGGNTGGNNTGNTPAPTPQNPPATTTSTTVNPPSNTSPGEVNPNQNTTPLPPRTTFPTPTTEAPPSGIQQ